MREPIDITIRIQSEKDTTGCDIALDETKMQLIKRKIGENELLAQIAESSADLTNAALKLRKANLGLTPVPKEYIYNKFIEAVAEVILCMDVLSFDDEILTILNIAGQKLENWHAKVKVGENHG